jgi:hypothetical protein
MGTFYFNTGVSIRSGSPLCKGQVWSSNGVKLIPFECTDVPDDVTFKFACDNPNLYPNSGFLVREIHNSTLVSKFAYFQ